MTRICTSFFDGKVVKLTPETIAKLPKPEVRLYKVNKTISGDLITAFDDILIAAGAVERVGMSIHNKRGELVTGRIRARFVREVLEANYALP